MPSEVVVVGGGLVGALSAIMFARRGERVNLYELRKDLRGEPEQRGRSINLALSARGIAALVSVGVFDKVAPMLVPMRGRLLHGLDGQLTDVPYGVFGEAINSVDRRRLNEILLDEAEQCENVTLHFQHELAETSLDERSAVFRNKATGEMVSVQADLFVGADGAYSAMRKELMRRTRMNFSQKYIQHGYMELTMPALAVHNGNSRTVAATVDSFAMDGQHLHIWPRHAFMMIALPNADKSFTCTLFMPFENFEALRTGADVLRFFEMYFPDSIALFGRDYLVDAVLSNPVGPLVSVKCSPYHYKNSAVIIGDAAHAMVPFYGQGMNCGFEDCLVLDQILYGGPNGHVLSRHVSPRRLPTGQLDTSRLHEYTDVRHHDATAIVDLAMYNYIEMRSAVLSWHYRLRKVVESALHRIMPRTVIPLYTMVSFTQIPYSVVWRRWHRQTHWFNAGLGVTVVSTLATVCTAAVYAWRMYRRRMAV